MLDFECTTSKHFISNGKNAATKAKIQNLAENRRLTASGLERASSFDSAALPQRLWTLKDFPFETFILPCFSQWWVTLQTSPYQLHTQGRIGTMPSHEIGFIYNYSYEIVHLYNPSNHVFHKRTEILQQNDNICVCFWRHSMWAAQST